MGESTELRDVVIAAHGGMDRWRQLSTVRAHLAAGGVLFALKQQEGVLADVDVTVELHRQWASQEPFGEPGLRSVFTGDHIALETTDGVVDERSRPRDSFAGHRRDTPWDRLQLAYFGAYAIRNYLTAPFSFAEPGFGTEEVEPWQEGGETWRRLVVTFPEHVATHNAEQIFYVDADGLIRRQDYRAEVVNGGWAAHYSHGHRTVDGIVVPVRRRVYPLGPDGRPVLDTVVVALDLDHIAFS